MNAPDTALSRSVTRVPVHRASLAHIPVDRTHRPWLARRLGWVLCPLAAGQAGRAPLGSRTRFRLRPPPHRPRPPPAQQLASDPPAGRPPALPATRGRSPSSSRPARRRRPRTSAQASPGRFHHVRRPRVGLVPVLWRCQWQRRRDDRDRRRPAEGRLGDDHCHPVTRRDPGRANVAGWATKQLPKAITSGASPFRKRSGDPQRDRSARRKNQNKWPFTLLNEPRDRARAPLTARRCG